MNTGDIKVIQLANYVKPEVKEKPGDKWVLYGRHNEFFQYIIDRYKGSPTNESVINVYNQLLWGRGIAVRGEKELYLDLFEIFNKRDVRKCLNDFELFGQCAVELIRAKGGGVARMNHLPFDKLGMGRKTDKNEIENVYYCEDWSKLHSNKPVEIPVFKGKMTEARMVLLIQPYIAGNDYYSDPDYLAGLQYAHLEEEISNYCINHIRNGLSFGYIINFNNGSALTPEQKDEIEDKIKEKLTGTSNAGKFILSFNDGDDTAGTVVPLDVNEAHSQWEFLSRESMSKILTAHGVTSPLLFGLPSAGGFGSNAEELDTASKLLQDYQIKPKQEFFIDEIATVLQLNNLETDLVFIPLRDSYTTDQVEGDVTDDTVDESEDVQMSSDDCTHDEGATPEMADELISLGIDLGDEWEVLCENPVDYETDDIIYELIQFASTGTARPNAKSEQDSEDIKVLYKYAGSITPQREFCKKMMAANKLYRKEDILMMDDKPVNPGFGVKGANTYSIWLYKGSVNCKHQWNRVIFVKKDGEVDVRSPLAERIAVAEARRRGYDIPVNDPKVGRKPNNMPNGGAYPL